MLSWFDKLLELLLGVVLYKKKNNQRDPKIVAGHIFKLQLLCIRSWHGVHVQYPCMPQIVQIACNQVVSARPLRASFRIKTFIFCGTEIVQIA
jgi:hypothetical protein